MVEEGKVIGVQLLEGKEEKVGRKQGSTGLFRSCKLIKVTNS